MQDQKDTAMQATGDTSEIDFLHEIGARFAAADPLHTVLDRVVTFVSTIIQCDSCFIYVLDEDALVLRASKNPHADIVDRLTLRVGQGITGWVAAHRQPVHWRQPQRGDGTERQRQFHRWRHRRIACL